MKFLFIIFLSTINMINLYSQQEKQTPHNFQKEITLTFSANYLLYLPTDYKDADRDFPLVLFLHGSGERGTDIEKVKIHGLPKLINQGKDFPFIVVSPQCPDDIFWNVDILNALLDEIVAKYRVDTNRIYVTGLSMGGHGTWELALRQPNRFAAIAPVCGWADTSKACSIAHIPTWVFHGAKDAVVPVKAAEDMVDALKNCGSNVKLTIYPEANHDSWTETYNNEELYKWLLEQSLDKK
ncbi:MAG TPA: phospholipase [Ignavibacteriales bacterium]|nr:phospholipase [Ignavibacteriales bacterium]